LYGLLFEVPNPKIGAGDVLLAWKVGKMLPGGLPRYCFFCLAEGMWHHSEREMDRREDHTMEGLLSTKKMPIAIMCSNDMTAIGVLHKLYRAGLRVPDDFSIIGFDKKHIAEVTIPPLTTVEMSRLDLARAAVTALREQVELVGNSPKKGEFCVRTNLVVRESTNFPREQLSLS
jgi:DNA-binding LacI/PurR family transcriptional regulator